MAIYASTKAWWAGGTRPQAMASKVDSTGTRWKCTFAEGRDISMALAALLLKCSPPTVYTWLEEGRLRRGTNKKYKCVTYCSVKELAIKLGVIKKGYMQRRRSYWPPMQ